MLDLTPHSENLEGPETRWAPGFASQEVARTVMRPILLPPLAVGHGAGSNNGHSGVNLEPRSGNGNTPENPPRRLHSSQRAGGGAQRICHLAKYYPPYPGGIETHVQTLARAQSALGAETTVLCVNGHDAQGNRKGMTQTQVERDGNVLVIRLGRLFSLARFDFCPGFLRQFWRVLHRDFDVIHLHTPNPTMLLAWAIASILAWMKRQPPIPLVVTHHSDIVKQQFLKYLLRPLEYFVYSQATSILTTSDQYIEGSKFLRAFRQNVSALPLGLDLREYRSPSPWVLEQAEQMRTHYGQPLWLFVGRLVYYKALHVALEALVHVPGTLLIMGSGPLEDELKALAKTLGVGDRTVWWGYARNEEIMAAYRAATALWFPSNQRSEGFGIVQLEAMASGCPVINTHIPCSGVSWVCRHEKEGLTVPINQPLAFAKAANRLWWEPNLRSRLCEAGLRRVGDFDHRLMAKQSLQVYHNALKNGAYPHQVAQSMPPV